MFFSADSSHSQSPNPLQDNVRACLLLLVIMGATQLPTLVANSFNELIRNGKSFMMFREREKSFALFLS